MVKTTPITISHHKRYYNLLIFFFSFYFVSKCGKEQYYLACVIYDLVELCARARMGVDTDYV